MPKRNASVHLHMTCVVSSTTCRQDMRQSQRSSRAIQTFSMDIIPPDIFPPDISPLPDNSLLHGVGHFPLPPPLFANLQYEAIQGLQLTCTKLVAVYRLGSAVGLQGFQIFAVTAGENVLGGRKIVRAGKISWGICPGGNVQGENVLHLFKMTLETSAEEAKLRHARPIQLPTSLQPQHRREQILFAK